MSSDDDDDVCVCKRGKNMQAKLTLFTFRRDYATAGYRVCEKVRREKLGKNIAR